MIDNKTITKIINKELRIWRCCYPKRKKLLIAFANKLRFELTLENQREEDKIDLVTNCPLGETMPDFNRTDTELFSEVKSIKHPQYNPRLSVLQNFKRALEIGRTGVKNEK